jgi:ABC-type lipoprotein release transport system permease subunit
MQALLPTIASAVLIGLILNIGMQRILRHWMPAATHSLWIPAGVTALLMLILAAACLVPAVRAAYADPLETLRTE